MVLAIAPGLLMAGKRIESKPPVNAVGWFGSPPDAANLAAYMLESDVVAIGELTMIDSLPAEHVMRGVAAERDSLQGMMPRFPSNYYTVIFRIREVLLGCAPDSVISLEVFLDPGNLRFGREVLLNAGHERDKMIGNASVIRANGDILWPVGWQGHPRLVRLSQLRSALKPIARQHPSRSFNGAGAVALASLSFRPDGIATVGRIKLVAGSAATLPSYLKLAGPRGCGVLIDSLRRAEVVIPIPRGFRDSVLVVSGCCSRLVVQRGFVPAFSARVEGLDRVLAVERGRIRVRSVLSR